MTYLSSVNIGTSAIGSMCVLSLRKSHHIHRTIPPSSLGTSSLPGVTHTQAPKSTPEQLRHRRSGRHADVMTPNALQPSCLCFCFSSDGPVFLLSWTSSDCRFPRTAINTRSCFVHSRSCRICRSYDRISLSCSEPSASFSPHRNLERRSRSRTAEIRLFACHVAHCSYLDCKVPWACVWVDKLNGLLRWLRYPCYTRECACTQCYFPCTAAPS